MRKSTFARGVAHPYPSHKGEKNISHLETLLHFAGEYFLGLDQPVTDVNPLPSRSLA